MNFLWAFDSDASMALIPWDAALFMLGGGGEKWIRRFGIPALHLLANVAAGKSLIFSLISFALLSVILTIQYGDSVKDKLGDWYFPFLAGLGASYGFSILPVASSFWHVLLPVVPCIALWTLTYISQKNRWFSWKMVEMLVGGSIGYVQWMLIK